MDRVLVTIRYGQDKRVDLALPAEVPHQFLAEALANALGMPQGSRQAYYIQMMTPSGPKRLSPAATLTSAKVYAASVLDLLLDENAFSHEAYLITEAGLRFALNRSNVIGRQDAKDTLSVDIDLGPVGGKIISHHHALIKVINDHYVFEDQRSTNGTWINGEKMDPLKQRGLVDGDVIDFGPRGKGVSVVFHCK